MDDNRSSRIENKLDRVAEQVADINVHMAEIRKDLKYHIKRTDILERRVVPVWTTFRAIGFLIGLVSVAAAVAEILGLFKHVQ